MSAKKTSFANQIILVVILFFLIANLFIIEPESKDGQVQCLSNQQALCRSQLKLHIQRKLLHSNYTGYRLADDAEVVKALGGSEDYEADYCELLNQTLSKGVLLDLEAATHVKVGSDDK